MTVPVAGGNPVVLAAKQYYPHVIAMRAGTVYWSDWGKYTRKLQVGGGKIADVGDFGSNNIALDVDSLYFTYVSGNGMSSSLCRLVL